MSLHVEFPYVVEATQVREYINEEPDEVPITYRFETLLEAVEKADKMSRFTLRGNEETGMVYYKDICVCRLELLEVFNNE